MPQRAPTTPLRRLQTFPPAPQNGEVRTQTGRWCHEQETARFDPSRILDLDRPNQWLMTIADIRSARVQRSLRSCCALSIPPAASE
jgi:hypothetical protein